MFDANAAQLLQRIQPGDLVLDVGAWACPFNRATHVLDAQPWATRGAYARMFGGPGSQGGPTEHFTAETWVVRDICDHTPWPFDDHQFDWAICSHTLEDVRDPLWVVSELCRVAKRGYIEVPSRRAESSRGWESPRIAGLTHHRWLIDIDTATQSIRFTMKPHGMHTHWRYSLPASSLSAMSPAERVQWLVWEGPVRCEEITLHGTDIFEDLERFVRSVQPYPGWRLAAANLRRGLGALVDRALRKMR